MLQLVLGRAGYGKTNFVFSSIKELVESGEDNILLITPEQYSFVSERRLLTDLGESRVNCVENSSFSRLSSEAFKLYGDDSLPTLSKGAKAILMKKAIENVSDGLVLFGNNALNNSFVNSFIKIYDEMKSCRVSADDILLASDNTEREILSLKLKDISLIINSYDALIKDKFNDPANELTRLYHKLLDKDYFKDRYVFVDGFSGFVAQEYKILEIIIKQAKCVYLTLCTDSYNNFDKYNLFSYVNSNIAILKDVTKKANASFMNPKTLDTPYRFKSDDLKVVEKNAFLKKITNKALNENIHIYSSNSIYDECDNASKNILKLLRQGVKASEIAVICRDLDKYNNELVSSFRRYNIPFFDDERQDISSQPLIMFVNYLLRCIIYSYRSDDIFSMLKTGLCNLENDEINKLENYVFLWNINGSKWKNEFVQSTKGFVESISSNDQSQIDLLNSSRQYIIERLEKFKYATKNKSAKDICKSLYYTLLSFSADKKLKDLAITLDNNGKSSLAKEQGRVWDLLMDILDKLAMVCDDSNISIKEFYNLFNLMIESEDLGTIPTGLDNVQVGAADRIRCDNPKYVFILGANEGEFPQSVSSAGLLSENDRIDLINNKFKLYSYGETLNAQEKYFAYMAMSSATDGLYISYRLEGKYSESSIVRNVCDSISDIVIEKRSNDITIDDIESEENAFEILASSYNDNTEMVSSLKQYFSSKPEYSGRISAVDRLIKNEDIVIKNKELSTNLFKNNMYLSASKIEDYYNCAFRYFCKFGVCARPRQKAEMNPMQTGIVIHSILETILMQKGKEGLISLKDEEIIILVNALLKDFLDNRMGDSSEFTARFKYQFMRLSRMLVSVIKRLRDEFSQSDFVPRAFELKIGNGIKNEPVKSKIITLPNNGSIEINGSIDRVDTYETNGKTYVRVVDYKSGNKKFELNDILCGLNLQMFIYLFNLCDDDNEYSGIASGVLYLHSAKPVENVDRNPTESTIQSKERSNFKMKGVILNDDENEIAEHMERDLKGEYIPAKMTKTKGITGNIVTLEELGRISRHIDKMIENMGVNLHNGNISQNPIDTKNHTETCEHCDYIDVCRNRIEIQPHTVEEMDNATVLNKLKEDDADANLD